ncbi:protein-glutamate O-methyltransferase CheR [Anaeromyxobacter sp. PSR-1]|uniref:CheR family methyltransferase n=1 Tax=Anaeromyxobacter sp. PSR-1 TaxID=1300915 RepID=UPI0005E35D8D|nr:CheR family methyltransferase [Anaeromyxobacter sp. PSR-1]GAO01167.1 chemotaxis protein methyltransferase 3 [Anaeromyxobacter sp. PSR-1]
MAATPLTPATWSRLTASISRWTGFHPDAIWARAVLRALAPLLDGGTAPDELIALAERDDPALRRRLTQAVPVGETYFFRIPEHFALVRNVLAPRWAAEPARPRAVWSAGCAGGEEAYSLAAVLRAAGVRAFEVVGTDLVEANVAAARAARYGAWSLRASVPAVEDPFLPAAGEGPREVDPALRSRARFEVHNLLDAAPPPGRFDLIFCRNVLIYFTHAAAARALSSLAAALAPGGVIAFATMDLSEAPAPLVRLGAPELQVFQRPPVDGALRAAPEPARPVSTVPAPPPSTGPGAPLRPPSARAAHRPAPPPPPAAAPEPVSLHLRVLAQIERGDHAGARALLGDLRRAAPQYLPGLLEGALLCAREGRRAHALELMRSVLDRAQALPSEAPVAGPETLPARFYAAAARRFLGGEVPR